MTWPAWCVTLFATAWWTAVPEMSRNACSKGLPPAALPHVLCPAAALCKRTVPAAGLSRGRTPPPARTRRLGRGPRRLQGIGSARPGFQRASQQHRQDGPLHRTAHQRVACCCLGAIDPDHCPASQPRPLPGPRHGLGVARIDHHDIGLPRLGVVENFEAWRAPLGHLHQAFQQLPLDRLQALDRQFEHGCRIGGWHCGGLSWGGRGIRSENRGAQQRIVLVRCRGFTRNRTHGVRRVPSRFR